MATSANPDLDTPHPTVLCELGPLGVEAEGQWSAVRGLRTAMLLAALRLAGRTGVRTDELTEMIWPSPDQPPTARQSLANIVARVRSSYGATFVESTRHGYRIGEHVQSDRTRFVDDIARATDVVDHRPADALEIVDGALVRWRGEPWLGIERPVTVEADRAHLMSVRRDALRIRATASAALGRREPALADLREVLTSDPFDERSRLQLVRILSGTGRRAEALRSISEAHRLFARRGLVVDRALVDEERRMLDEGFTSFDEPAPLPEQPTDFVGRDREIDEIETALRQNRLVTLHGIGGSGKTRLAVHVARRSGEPSALGFVDLSGARTPSQVDLAFARGLGLATNRLDGASADERVEILAGAAVPKAGILVVDNCEHVVADVRTVVNGLLDRAQRLRLLATSRIPLDVAGEYRYPIPPFAQADELFRRRCAQRGEPLDADRHDDAVTRICALVDHLPLAIEIAAAQAPYRTVDEIADELEHGVTQRDLSQQDERHETMATTIRWSHDLLDPVAADALVDLGIFDDPFRRADAAAAVGTDRVGDVLDRLVHHSLIERNDDRGRSTYRLTVPVRQFAATELDRRAERIDVLLRYADWLLEDTDRPYGDVWWRLSVVDDLRPRLSNALAAVAALRAVDRIDDATRLAGRLGGAARQSGRSDELIEVLVELWPGCRDDIARSDALVALAECADAARQDETFDRTLGLLAALDGTLGERHRVYVHCEHALWLMWAARLDGADYGPAHLELRRARHHPAAQASPLNRVLIEQWQSGLHLLAGDWVAAEAAARRALDESSDMVFDTHARSCLCHARLHLGDADEALRISELAARRDNPHGDLLGTVAAIARIQRGEIADGLAGITRIQRAARRGPFAILQDDAAITIGYVAHLLHDDDIAARILDTGVVGYGPWIGHLVPKMCRELGIPLTGHASTSLAERQRRSDHYGTVADRVLHELCDRHGISVASR